MYLPQRHNQQKILVKVSSTPPSTPSSQAVTAYVGQSGPGWQLHPQSNSARQSSGTVYNLGDHRERDDRPMTFVTIEPNVAKARGRAVHGGVHDEGHELLLPARNDKLLRRHGDYGPIGSAVADCVALVSSHIGHCSSYDSCLVEHSYGY